MCPVVKHVYLLTSLEINLFLSAIPLFDVKSLEGKLPSQFCKGDLGSEVSLFRYAGVFSWDNQISCHRV